MFKNFTCKNTTNPVNYQIFHKNRDIFPTIMLNFVAIKQHQSWISKNFIQSISNIL